jgi:hypothetical protein
MSVVKIDLSCVIERDHVDVDDRANSANRSDHEDSPSGYLQRCRVILNSSLSALRFPTKLRRMSAAYEVVDPFVLSLSKQSWFREPFDKLRANGEEQNSLLRIAANNLRENSARQREGANLWVSPMCVPRRGSRSEKIQRQGVWRNLCAECGVQRHCSSAESLVEGVCKGSIHRSNIRQSSYL